jgi:hypothetical protein
MRPTARPCRSAKALVFVFSVALLSPAAPAAAEGSDAIPTVHFAVIRSDFLTYEIKGYYEFSDPMRKSLPEPDFAEYFVQYGDVFAYDLDAGDYGERTLDSRLTGKQLVGVSWMWSGLGGFWYPPDSLLSTDFETGFTNPEPDTLIFGWGVDPFYPVDPAIAWNVVSHTDIIQRLSSLGSYEVFYFGWFYEYGVANPNTAEWIFIACTRPPAPDDMAFTAITWPKKLVTKGAEVAPEITAHNFGDGPVEASVRFTLTSPSGPVIGFVRPLGVVPADESLTVLFPKINIEDDVPVTFEFDFETPSGGPWLDAYPENDEWDEHVSITRQPTFRRAYNLPGSCSPLDFDGDGDIDLVYMRDFIKLWQNDGAGNFTDITSLSPVTLRPDPLAVLAEDFNGDGFTDLVVIHEAQPAQLLAGNGTGVFTEPPADPVLSSVIAYNDVAVLDLENDGDKDIVFQRYNTGHRVLKNDGSAHFTDVTAESGITALVKGTALRAADFDNDGDTDIIASRWGDRPVLFANDGTGVFSVAHNDWESMYCPSCMVLDYDQDGLQDVFFCHAMSGSMLFRNWGGLEFHSVLPLLPGCDYASSADINGDSFPDVLLDEGNLLLNFNSVFTDSSALLIDPPYWLGPGRFVDLNGDSALDIYAGRGAFINQTDVDETDPVFVSLFSAHATGRGVDLAWDVVADEAVAAFYIRRTNSDGSGQVVLNSGRPLPSSARSFTDTAVERPGTYKYRLRVVCTGGAEALSQELTVETGGFPLALHQNYPNPFNPATTIAFSLPRKTPVTLAIYTAEGRLVKTIIDETLDAGPREITWDATDMKGNAVSSGVYFCRLKAGSRILTKKMVVLK